MWHGVGVSCVPRQRYTAHLRSLLRKTMWRWSTEMPSPVIKIGKFSLATCVLFARLVIGSLIRCCEWMLTASDRPACWLYVDEKHNWMCNWIQNALKNCSDTGSPISLYNLRETGVSSAKKLFETIGILDRCQWWKQYWGIIRVDQVFNLTE